MKVGKILGLFGLAGLVGAVMFGTTACPPVVNNEDAGVDAGVDAGFTQPAGTTPINFTIDASGRPGFYANGDLEWKGSFSYDKDTRILTYDASWAGGVGPYAGLWDDGPWTSGGHEPIGAVAGDDKFGITVFMNTPATDTTIEYGAQTKAGGWIWQGSNGTVLIPANSTAAVTAAGLTLPPEGTVDLKLMLDTNNLGSGFTHAAGEAITVKGQMSDWGDDPAFDDGTHGDATASDGIYTYTLSQNAIRRLKLTSGTNVEFIWAFHPVQADGGTGYSEYKTGGGVAEQTGVSAETNTAGAGWVSATISINASNNNTQVAIP